METGNTVPPYDLLLLDSENCLKQNGSTTRHFDADIDDDSCLVDTVELGRNECNAVKRDKRGLILVGLV